LPGLVAVNWKGPPETLQTQRAHKLEAGQPFQVLGVPFPQLRVLGLLADDRVLHDGVAEVIYHRRDGEYAPKPLIQTCLRRGFLRGFLGLSVGVIGPRQSDWGGAQRQSCD